MNRLGKLLKRVDRLMRQEQPWQAAQVLEQILATRPVDDKTCEVLSAYLGDIYLALDDLPRAETNITHALEHNSGASHYHYLLGMVYSAGLRWREAIDALWHALELSPDDDEYLRALGWAVFSSGDEAQGRSLLQEALRVNVSNMVTLTDLALVYTRATQFPEALDCARQALELDPHSILAKDVLRVVQLRKLEHERVEAKKGGQIAEVGMAP